MNLANSKRAAGCGIVHENEILLAKRCEFFEGEPASMPNFWSIFTGLLDEGENPMIGAIRETYEESGIQLELQDLNYVGQLYNKNDNVELEVYMSCLKTRPTVKLNEENTEYIWFPLENIENFPYTIQYDMVQCIIEYRTKLKNLKKYYNQ